MNDLRSRAGAATATRSTTVSGVLSRILGVAGLMVAGGGLLATATAPACSGESWSTDGFPIDLPPRGGPAGGLLARRGTGTGDLMVIDTGSPLTFVRGEADGSAHMTRRSFEILGDRPGIAGGYPLRASFRDIAVLPVKLDPAGPDLVLGTDVLRAFSVQIDFGAPSMTLWSGQRAPDAFVGAAQCAGPVTSPTCFADLHFTLLGGGELTAVSEPDFLGLTGPVEFGATRVLLRACAAPAEADPLTYGEQPTCCTRAAAVTLSASVSPAQLGYAPTGTDLALLVATGLGPTVLAESAWNAIVTNWARLPGAAPLPAPVDGPAVSFPTLPDPMTNVKWSELPRLALVDLETDPSMNPGSCVDLARARRLEWIERRRAEAIFACAQVCDTDVRESGKAQNAAGYIEMGGNVKVAIIPDAAPVLQLVRAELRQQGPQVDGFLGTDVLATTKMEIDYGASPPRMVFSCQPGLDRATCWTSPRCARQASPGDVHSCFGLPPQPLPDPSTCAPSGCS